MKKVILFTWFGDEKPPYIQWTLENFRQMNPGWEIKFVNYSNEQIKNYKEQNDTILEKSMNNLLNLYNHTCNNLADTYRYNYLNSDEENLVIYCDLDCFPIASFDNFIVKPGEEDTNWFTKIHAPKHLPQAKNLGVWSFPFSSSHTIHHDSWCLCNSRICTDMFLQIHKGTKANEDLIYHHGMAMNRNDIPQYDQRAKDFHEMKIELGNNFCLPQFTPIEHYFSYERNKLNLDCGGKL